jgi:hypothetical protein
MTMITNSSSVPALSTLNAFPCRLVEAFVVNFADVGDQTDAQHFWFGAICFGGLSRSGGRCWSGGRLRSGLLPATCGNQRRNEQQCDERE